MNRIVIIALFLSITLVGCTFAFKTESGTMTMKVVEKKKEVYEGKTVFRIIGEGKKERFHMYKDDWEKINVGKVYLFKYEKRDNEPVEILGFQEPQ
ncbi:hypothetical protein [Laceyella putida]|uniref:DUF3221 domain-containing protein n=1 Tax=Laceyella putida TaxID=110101 RepID=A0ABW2RM25_9BACL